MKYIGVDLGGTNIVAGLIDENYKILDTQSCKTNVPRRTEELCEDITKLITALIKKSIYSMNDIDWVGIGIPGSVNPITGVVPFATNLFVENWEIVNMLEERLNSEFLYQTYSIKRRDEKLRVYIENDANAAAYGEFLAGALKGTQNSVAVTLGTGVGGGIIIDKRLYRGSNFAAGEFGHMVIEKDGIQCTCGRKGCWERYSSATGLINMTKEAMQKDRFSLMWNTAKTLDEVDGKTSFDAAAKGDATAAKVIDKFIEYLACGIGNVINILQPDKICIGGGISRQGDNLILPLVEKVNTEVYSKNIDKQTEICVAELGNNAGIIGAALLGRLC